MFKTILVPGVAWHKVASTKTEKIKTRKLSLAQREKIIFLLTLTLFFHLLFLRNNLFFIAKENRK